MYVVHAHRLQPVDDARDCGLLDSSLRFFMWAEPFIAASFLFIVGFSLALSRQKYGPSRAWLRRLLTRAVVLYVLSVLLFIPHYGLQLPDLLVSSGILSVIALAIIVVGTTLTGARPAAILVLVASGAALATVALERSGLSVPGLNAGPGGTLPLIAFAAVGALAALLERRAGLRGVAIATAVSAVPLAAACLLDGSWVTSHVSLYRDQGGTLALASLVDASSGSPTPVHFWNHSAWGLLGLLFPLGVSLLSCLGLQQMLARWGAFRAVMLLGRHALGAYVGHLVVLGALALTGFVPPDARWTWALIGGLACAATLAAAAVDARSQSAASRRSPVRTEDSIPG
jgi:hypothetical protein